MTKTYNWLEKILRVLAKATLRKYQPGIVAVTGTVGKTSTQETAYTVLRQARRTRTGGNPLLTILGDWPENGGAIFWLRVILTAAKNLLFAAGDYPEILILEYAADRPGDIRRLLEIARPQIGVVTGVSDVPAHVEFYSGPEAVAREKSRIIEALPAAGFAVLNGDDEMALAMREKTRAHTVTFGFGDDSQIKIFGFNNRSEQLPTGQWKPAGVSFKLEYDGNFVPVRLDGVFGRVQAYAAAAAAAIGLSFGINLVRIVEAFHYYQPSSRRMKLLSGIKGTFIIDDSDEASPLSMRAALETIGDLKAKRKVAVLGDMLELGQYAIETHEAVGRLYHRNIDVLVTIGSRSKFIADAAIKNGFNKNKALSFDTADQAKLEVQGLLEKGDLVLVKGAREMELDRIIKEIQLI